MGICFVDGLGFDEVSWHGSVGKPCSSVPLNVAFAFNENGYVTEDMIFKQIQKKMLSSIYCE